MYDDRGEYFQSYNKVIAYIPMYADGGPRKLDKEYWDYSKTTGKYRNIFLGEDKNTTLKKIQRGEYTLVNLNE